MRQIILSILILLLSFTQSKAEFDSIPDYSMLVSQIDDITFVDSFAVTVTTNGVALFQFDSSTASFHFLNQLFINFEEAAMKRFDNLVVVKTDDDKLHFIDISFLPDLNYLGAVDFNVPFSDFILIGNEIYISVWFDGIWRFILEDYQTINFADSSMKGILVTQLEEYGGYLYALDEYNGILRYDISGEGFGELIDYLYVPLRVSSFIKYDSLFCLLLKTGGAYFGDFNQPGNMIVDSILNIPPPQKAYLTDSLLLFLVPRQMYLVERNNFDSQSYVDLNYNGINGDIFVFEEKLHIVLPDVAGGVTFFNLQEDAAPFQGFYRPGQINSIVIHNDKLITGALSNPIDVYDISFSNQVTFDYTIFNQINSVTTMTQNGDTLLVLYPQLNQIALITNSTDSDSLFLDNAYFVDASGVQNIQYLQNKINGYRLFLIEKQEQIDVYTISDSGFIDYAKTWEFIWSIQSVSVKDSLLFLGTSKNQLLVYDIASDFELIYKTNINLTGNAVKSIVLNNRLLVFEWNKMYVIDVTNNDNISVEYDISLPLPVLDAAYYDNQLFTVGPDGINVFDWSQPEPVLIDYGGLGGNIIAAGNNLLAVSDGNGVHVYYLDSLSGIILATPDDEIIPFQFNLTQNFPNPFNLETIIKYTIPKTAQVELSVFNILGQKVKTLVNDIKPAGEFNAYWNGSNHDGTTVSTGVYFYRLAVEDYIETKKMILLK